MIEQNVATTASAPIEKRERRIFELPVIEPARTIARNTYEIRIAKPQDFSFMAGQSMKFFPNEAWGSSFTIVSAPEQNFLCFTFRGSESVLKKRMLSLVRDDVVPLRDVKRINDTFHYPEGDEVGVPVVMIAGGVGITPFASMLRHAAMTGDRRRFILFYANHSEDDIAYRNELKEYENTNVQLKTHHYLSQGGSRFTADTVSFPDDAQSIFYIAGPVVMVQETVRVLKDRGVPDARIRYKEFTGYEGADDVTR